MHRSLIYWTRRRWLKSFVHRKLCLVLSLIYSFCVESYFSRACGIFLNVDTRLWTVFKIHVLCVRFYMCLSFLQKREDICHRHGGTHPVTSVSFFFHFVWACVSSFTVRSIHWVLRDAHHLGLVAVISNIVHTRPPRWLFAYACIADTHSTLQGAAPVMLCFFIHSLSECTILDTIDPFGLSYAWKHTVTCALVAMSVFIGALLSWNTLLRKLRWIGAVRPPPGIRCWQQQ